MSFFPVEYPSFDAEHEDCREEIADGVVLERRSLFMLSAGAVTALLAGAPTLGAQAPTPADAPLTGGLSYEEFLAQLYPLARKLVDSGGKDEEAYVMTVAAALTRLRDPKAPLREAMQQFRAQHKQDEQAAGRFPLYAVSMELEPGKGFSHHDHLDYNGVIMGVEGEARVRNYDFVDEPPEFGSTKTFRIRETRDDLILPGRISTLGRKRENVHDLVAGKKGCRVLDVFTFYSRRAGSRGIDVETKPRDADQRIYDAAWQPRKRRDG